MGNSKSHVLGFTSHTDDEIADIYIEQMDVADLYKDL